MRMILKRFGLLENLKKTYSSEVVKVPRVWSAVSNSTPGTSRAAGVGNIVTI